MPSLSDVQVLVCRAVTLHDPCTATLPIVGGADPHQRFAIHQRHYETSLTRAIQEKFPATMWLLGEDVFDRAARRYVAVRPPRRACIAEYGDDFPAFLGREAGLADLSYLESFGELEWHAGQVSIAIDRQPRPWGEIAQLGSAALLNARVVLQPGLRHLRTSWPIDHLLTAYLTDSAPPTFVMTHGEVNIEIRGARGSLHLRRVDRATSVFRTALLTHRTVGDAAAAALSCEPGFDAGKALAALVSDGLVTDIVPVMEGAS